MQKLQAINLSDQQASKQALQSAIGGVSNTYANMTKSQKTTPDRSVGGAIGTAGAGALAAGMLQVGGATGNPYAMGAGAATGLLSYYL